MIRGVPQHVLMTSDAVGGVWTYAIELARGLTQRGCRVTLANFGPYASHAQQAEVAAIPNLRMLQRALRLEWMDDAWDDVAKAGEWLLELEQDLKPEIVHLNGYCHAALPWRTPRVVVGHSCVCSWWQHVKGESIPERHARYRDSVIAGLRAANLVIAPTAAMLGDLREQYGEGWQGHVIPNGRDAVRFRRKQKEPFVFSSGRLWDEAKNIPVLDHAAAHVAWPVYVAGSAQHPSGRAYESVSLQALGMLPLAAMSDWYSRAAVYAAPARYEPFGLAVLEAALSGCALVLSNIASFRELWNGAALFVEPDNEAAWAQALTDLAESPSLRKELSEAAWRRAGTYSTERMVDGYLLAYEAVLNRSKRRMACVS